MGRRARSSSSPASYCCPTRPAPAFRPKVCSSTSTCINNSGNRNSANPARRRSKSALPAPATSDDKLDDARALRPSGERGLRQPQLSGLELCQCQPGRRHCRAVAARENRLDLLEHRARKRRPGRLLAQLRGEGIATHALPREVMSDGQFKFLSGRSAASAKLPPRHLRVELRELRRRQSATSRVPAAGHHLVQRRGRAEDELDSPNARLRRADARRLFRLQPASRSTSKNCCTTSGTARTIPSSCAYLFQKIAPGEAFYQLWGGFSPQDMAWDAVDAAWQREYRAGGAKRSSRKTGAACAELRVNYVLCNILEDQTPMLAQLDDRPGALIWWSNVFFTFYSNWFHSIDERRGSTKPSSAA